MLDGFGSRPGPIQASRYRRCKLSSHGHLGLSSDYGWLRRNGIADFRKIQDIRVIRVDFGEDLDPNLPSGSPALWLGDNYPPEGSVSRFSICKRASEAYKLHYYPGWRQCQYLPLSTAAGYTTGLTVYLHSHSNAIAGVASHGTKSACLLLGSRLGLPLHFALNKGETLTSAWISESNVGPFIERTLAVIFPRVHMIPTLKRNLVGLTMRRR